ACKQPETTKHFLLLCCRYHDTCQQLIMALLKLKIPQTAHVVLTNLKAFELLANFIHHTGCFWWAIANKPP
ncbi:hypothetical protein CROQUDRAFT_667095, partial [Cronartium quercuum f. sp. fusiforme G11]